MVNFFQHPTALVETTQVGKGSKIWAYTHVLSGAVIGEETTICDFCFIEQGVKIGNQVTVKCGVYLWEGITVKDNVMIGPAAVFTNDRYHRSKNIDYKQEKTVLEKGCSVGANATLLAGVLIGEHALIGAGSVVSRNVPSFGLVYGNPARLHGFICICTQKMNFNRKNNYVCLCGRKFVKKTATYVEQL